MLRFAIGGVELIRNHRIEKAANWNHYEENLLSLIRGSEDRIFIVETKDKNGRNPIFIHTAIRGGFRQTTLRFNLFHETLTQADINTAVKRIAKLDKVNRYDYFVRPEITVSNGQLIADIWEVPVKGLEQASCNLMAALYSHVEQPAFLPNVVNRESNYPEAEQEDTAYVSVTSSMLTDEYRELARKRGYRHVGCVYRVM
ncbi:hypothetical protein pEaSNUABM29_00167 [Erwinia phage pEa_SNUABM_29]|nr:hypothetical protein pEaSNUABM29_00167 [Erwinia phage pEa_SNUABM_29]